MEKDLKQIGEQNDENQAAAEIQKATPKVPPAETDQQVKEKIENEKKAKEMAKNANQEMGEPEPEKIEVVVDIEQIQDDAVQMGFTDYFVENPCNCLWLGYALIILLSLMAGNRKYTQYTELSPRDFYSVKEPESIDYDILTMMNNYIILEDAENPVRSQVAGTMHIAYTNLDENNKNGLLQKDFLLKIKDLEERIRDDADFQKNCLSNGKDGSCSDKAISSPLDVLKLMKADKELDQMDQSEIDAIFAEAFKKKDVLDEIKDNFDRAYIEDALSEETSGRLLQSTKRVKLNNALESVAQEIKGQHMMMTVYLGGPLEVNGTVYKNSSQDQKVQDMFRRQFVTKVRDLTKAADYKDEQLGARITFGSKVISQEVLNENIGPSAVLSLALLIILFIYLAVRTGSKFISLVAVSIIMFANRIVLILTKEIFQVNNLPVLYIIALFFPQAMMADPVVTFVENWKKSNKIHPEVFENNAGKKMAYTVRTTTRTFIYTSGAIVLSMLVLFVTPMKVLRAFAVHGGFCILFTYYLLMMFLPSACVAYDMYIVGKKKCWTCFKKQQASVDGEQQNEEEERKVDLEQPEEKKEEVEEVKLGRIDNFYDTKLNKFIFWVRKPCTTLYILWFLTAMGKKYAPQSDLEMFVNTAKPPVDLMLDTAFTYGKGNGTEVSLYWGIKELNSTGVDIWNSDEIGKPIFDRKFNPASRQAQRYFKKVCQNLNKEDIVVQGTMRCWINDFEDYVEKKLGKTFPVSSESSFKKYLEKWSQSGIGAQYKADKYFAMKDDKIIFVKLTANTPLYTDSAGIVKQLEYNKWQTFIKEEEQSAPIQMQNGRQTSKVWPLIKTEHTYESYGRLPYLVAFIYAMIVFVNTTNNYYQVAFNLIFIWFVEFNTTSSRQKRNSAKVISQAVVCLGIAIFYVHYLSLAYIQSPYVERFHKMKQAYREQGGRLLKGSIMFFLSGLLLMITGRFTFCAEIGRAIIGSVIYSLIAMLFFGAVQHLFGPEKDAGLIRKKKVTNLETQQAIVMKLDSTFKQMADSENQVHSVEVASYTKLKSFRRDMHLMRQEMKEEKEDVKKLLDQILANTSK